MHVIQNNLTFLFKSTNVDTLSQGIRFKEHSIKELVSLINASVRQDDFISTSCKLVVGECLVPGFDVEINQGFENYFNEIFKSSNSAFYTIPDNIIEINDFQSSVIHQDENGDSYTVMSLPVFFVSEVPHPPSISSNNAITFLHDDVIDYCRVLLGNLEFITLGLGSSPALKSLFTIDFDVVFKLKGLFDKKSAILWKPFDHLFIKNDEITLAPFLSLIGFSEIWGNEKSELLERYVNFMRTFRVGIEILNILNINYKIVKANSFLFTTPDITADTLNFLLNMKSVTKDYVEDKLLRNDAFDKGTADRVEMISCEEAMSGTLVTLINWKKNERIELSTLIYPLVAENEYIMKNIESDIKNKLSATSSLNISTLDLYDTENSSKILQLLKK
jgi:hypothetical protein